MASARSALIVGGDEYSDPGLRRLRAPASDARALASVLQDPAIGGFGVRTLMNEPAHVVSLAVEEFFADRLPDDLLLLHFSCHGVKDEDGELYFAMANTVLRRLAATAVPADFVNRRMNRSRSRRIVLLLDCCYAGAFERGMTARAGSEVGIESQFGGRGRAVITASSAMEYAFEGDVLADSALTAPSVFTSALVQGLETGDADRDQDGLVALDELYDYIYDRVRAATPNQTPGKWTFGVQGELVIARRARPVTQPAPLPPELTDAIESRLASVRAAAVQELAVLLAGQHAGRALAARQALEHLTDDDSRTVAAAASAALGSTAAAAPPVPAPPVPAPPVPAPPVPAAPAPAAAAAPDPLIPAVTEPDRSPVTAPEPVSAPGPASPPEPASRQEARTAPAPEPRSASEPVPAASYDRLFRVAGLLSAVAAILLVSSLFPDFTSQGPLTSHWPSAWPTAVGSLSALVAAVLLFIRPTRRLAGPGVLIAAAAQAPSGLVLNLTVAVVNPPPGTGLWLNLAACVVAIAAACVTVGGLRRAGDVRAGRRPADLVAWLVAIAGAASAILLVGQVVRAPFVSGAGGPFTSQFAFPAIWSALVALTGPAIAVAAVPRSFGLALLAGLLADDLANAAYYATPNINLFGYAVIVLIIAAVAFSVTSRRRLSASVPRP